MSHASQTLFGPDGKPVGVFVPTAEWERVKADAEAWRSYEAFEAEKARALAEWVPTPATVEEMEEVGRLGDNSRVIEEIVARMYRTAGGGDGNR